MDKIYELLTTPVELSDSREMKFDVFIEKKLGEFTPNPVNEFQGLCKAFSVIIFVTSLFSCSAQKKIFIKL